jgi:shikimate kinase
MTTVNGNIVLIGFMGTGKTSVGKAISEKLQLDFVDLDIEIKQRFSMNISDIFLTYGEKHFRAMEEELVKELSSLKKHVISTGGGTVVNPKNIDILKKQGTVFWLNASVGKILTNIQNDPNQIHDRPLLNSKNVYHTASVLLKDREKYYKHLCDYNIQTDHLPITEVANHCIHLYHSLQSNGFPSFI